MRSSGKNKAVLYDTFHAGNFRALCDRLARKDPSLRGILRQHGYPPMWTRPPVFRTLVLTILEQQVSLASAYAAFKKLKNRVRYITPARILALSDEELRACYLSRQKIVYVRELAGAVQRRELVLKELAKASDEEVRSILKKIKGIGDWTVDVYLMHALQRTDLFPLGDVALVNSLRETRSLHASVSREEMLEIAEAWRPHRTIAAMILWHAYICKRGIKIQQ